MGAGNSQDHPSHPPAEKDRESSESSGYSTETRPAEVKLPETRPAELKLPHNCDILLKDADLLVDKSSTQKLYDQLYDGVFLNQKRKASHLVSIY